MLTIVCCLVVGLGLGLGLDRLVSGYVNVFVLRSVVIVTLLEMSASRRPVGRNMDQLAHGL